MWNSLLLFYGTKEIPSTKLGTNRILWGNWDMYLFIKRAALLNKVDILKNAKPNLNPEAPIPFTCK